LVGRDPGTDLAVLGLQGAQALRAIPMGDSDRLEVGDFVIAVGIPSD
jgi:serine protease Do